MIILTNVPLFHIMLLRRSVVLYEKEVLAMLDNMFRSDVLSSFIPISRFNKGEAGKIFDEVNKSGARIVVKNNKPTCVLISPEKYEEMMEKIEDYYLLEEAGKRMQYAQKADFTDHEDLLKEFNIEKDELKDIEVEIE